MVSRVLSRRLRYLSIRALFRQFLLLLLPLALIEQFLQSELVPRAFLGVPERRDFEEVSQGEDGERRREGVGRPGRGEREGRGLGVGGGV